MFNFRTISLIIRTYSLKSRYERLREKGYLTLREKMVELDSAQKQIRKMKDEGKIVFYRATEKEEYLYEPAEQKQIIFSRNSTVRKECSIKHSLFHMEMHLHSC
jgi:hypothetical protein